MKFIRVKGTPERILIILLKNECHPESEVSNSRNSGAKEILLVVQKAKITKNEQKRKIPKLACWSRFKKLFFSRINISHDLLCPSFSRSNRKNPKLSNFD